VTAFFTNRGRAAICDAEEEEEEEEVHQASGEEEEEEEAGAGGEDEEEEEEPGKELATDGWMGVLLVVGDKPSLEHGHHVASRRILLVLSSIKHLTRVDWGYIKWVVDAVLITSSL
jgi:hypothetical protein